MTTYVIHLNNPTMVLKDGILSIPIGPDNLDIKNSDYIEYKQWISEGNSPQLIEYVPKYDYIELRRLEYPPIEDLADAIYWQNNGNPTLMEEYLAKCEAVKLKYPKPE